MKKNLQEVLAENKKKIQEERARKFLEEQKREKRLRIILILIIIVLFSLLIVGCGIKRNNDLQKCINAGNSKEICLVKVG